MKSQVKRRYLDQKAPEYKIYNDYFDQGLIKSKYLNLGKESMPNFHTFIPDRNGIESAILEIEGNPIDGLFMNSDKNMVPAAIKYLKDKLKEIEAQFVDYCNRVELAGYDRPDVEPQSLFKERLRTEAALDIKYRELETLKFMIETFEDKIKEVDTSKQLQYGPCGITQIIGNEIVSIDNCRVEPMIITETVNKVERPKKIYVIVENKYSGVKVQDYRKYIAEPWTEQRKAIHDSLYNKQQSELINSGVSHTVVPSGVGLVRINPKDLPEIPENVIIYKKEVEKVRSE
jgi:hypothetical protein